MIYSSIGESWWQDEVLYCLDWEGKYIKWHWKYDFWKGR